MAEILKSLEIEDQKLLILSAETDKILYKSARNIPNVQVLEANKPTTYQILNADIILIQKDAVNVLQGSIESAEEVEA